VERGSNSNKYLETMDNSGIPLQTVNTVNQVGRKTMFISKQKILPGGGGNKYTAGHRVCELFCTVKKMV
jgi:hypothetical protein